MKFGEAIEYLKSAPHKGAKIARTGWNGKGMYVCYQAGYPTGIKINWNTVDATGLPDDTIAIFRPYLMFKAADDSFVPWVASQTDILEEDWEVVG